MGNLARVVFGKLAPQITAAIAVRRSWRKLIANPACNFARRFLKNKKQSLSGSISYIPIAAHRWAKWRFILISTIYIYNLSGSCRSLPIYLWSSRQVRLARPVPGNWKVNPGFNLSGILEKCNWWTSWNGPMCIRPAQRARTMCPTWTPWKNWILFASSNWNDRRLSWIIPRNRNKSLRLLDNTRAGDRVYT